jgi:hypothetical protein
MVQIGRYLDSHHGLYILNLALPFMVPTPLELTDTHGYREYQHRAADGCQNGNNGSGDFVLS